MIYCIILIVILLPAQVVDCEKSLMGPKQKYLPLPPVLGDRDCHFFLHTKVAISSHAFGDLAMAKKAHF